MTRDSYTHTPTRRDIYTLIHIHMHTQLAQEGRGQISTPTQQFHHMQHFHPTNIPPPIQPTLSVPHLSPNIDAHSAITRIALTFNMRWFVRPLMANSSSPSSDSQYMYAATVPAPSHTPPKADTHTEMHMPHAHIHMQHGHRPRHTHRTSCNLEGMPHRGE